jgi:hypothetical protein
VLSAVPAFTRPRYLAPALPVLAVVCAVLLAALWADPVANRRLRLVARGFLVLVGLGGLALALAGTTVAASWVVAGALTAMAAAMALGASQALTLVLLGIVAMLASGLVQVLVRPMVLESPGAALAACLSAPGPDDATPVLVGRLHELAADLRLLSGGHLHVETVPGLATLRTYEPAPAAVVAPEGIARRLETAGWRLRESWNLVRARPRGDACRAVATLLRRAPRDLVTYAAGDAGRSRKSTGRQRPARSSRTRSSMLRMSASNSVATMPMKLTRCESLPPKPA